MTVEAVENMDEVFNDEPETKVVEAEAQAEPSEPEVKDESKGENDNRVVETEPPSGEDEKTVPVAALLDERKKRQELEAQLSQYQKPELDTWTGEQIAMNPEGYKEHLKNVVEAESLVERIQGSRTKMLEKHLDYEDKERVFAFLNSQDPTLAQKMNAHPEPARFAYETATAHLETERAKMRAEIEAELKPADNPTPKTEIPKVLPNLTQAAASGSNTRPVETEYESIDDMFDD